MKRTRKVVFAAAAGIVTGFLYAGGRRLDRYDTLDLLDRFFYFEWVGKGILAALVFFLLWKLADRMSAVRPVLTGEEKRRLSAPVLHWIQVCILMLCWLPAFLSIVPGAFSYDAYAEWEQVKNGAITSHHPVIHVLLAGGLPELFHGLTGSYNAGIGVYTVLQMFLTANALSLTVSYICGKAGGRPVWRAAALLFYGFSPVIQLFAVCTTKDVLFTACELLFMVLVLRLTGEQDSFFTRRETGICFVAVVFGTMILRNNGLYIALFMLAVLFFACRRYWKKYLLLTGAVLLLYGIYRGPVYDTLSVEPGGIEEMFSVPIQQMARVYHYERDSLDAEKLDLLYRVLPEENLQAYKPTVADPVKSGFIREGYEANKKELLRLWIDWGLAYPLTYMNSFLVNTVDFWYPGAVVDGYRDPFGRSSYFDYRVAPPGEEIVLLPGLHGFYEKLSWDKQAQQKPLAFLILSPGWYFVMFLTVFLYLWRSRRKKLLLPLLVPLLTLATALLGPMALVRYVLIFFYCFPLLAALFFRPSAFET